MASCVWGKEVHRAARVLCIGRANLVVCELLTASCSHQRSRDRLSTSCSQTQVYADMP